MEQRIIYHGSDHIIRKPVFGLGKPCNDYGLGFYCTEDMELAKEWACSEAADGYVNSYQLSMDGLRILFLDREPYTILHWLAVLVEHRRFSLTTPLMRQGVEWLAENYHIDLEEYDLVIGYRADDSYFSFARSFLRNEISLEQLAYAMQLGGLGEQIVLISERAFSQLTFLDFEVAREEVYYPKRRSRDEQARRDYRAELERSVLKGAFIRDYMQGSIGGKGEDNGSIS